MERKRRGKRGRRKGELEIGTDQKGRREGKEKQEVGGEEMKWKDTEREGGTD